MARQRRRSKKPQDKRDKRDERREDMSRDDRGDSGKSFTNDVSWYETTPDLLRDAARVTFSLPMGSSYSRNVSFGSNISNEDMKQTCPGIMTLSLVPCPATWQYNVSGLNLAAKNLYAEVRRANSGSSSYDAPDLMMYAISMGQVYSYINFLQRIYGMIFLTDSYNKYLPKALIQANGVDYEEVNSNLANFRYGVNLLIEAAAKYACPASMTYFRRLAFLFSGLYAEGETVKDQLYMYVPAGFMQYQETTSTQGGMLAYLPFRDMSNLKTTSQLIKYGWSLLNNIMGSNDLKNMSGDILKAYGNNILTLQSLPEVYRIVPITDLTVLEQFKNADFLGQIPNTISITQDVDTNSIRGQLYVNSTNITNLMISTKNTHIMNTILTNPTAGDVMERSRLMFTSVFTDGETVSYHEIEATTEVGIELQYYSLDATTGVMQTTTVEPISVIASDNAAYLIQIHCALENFKFHPTVYYFVGTTTAGVYEYINAATDIDNYGIIDVQTLRNINEAATMALFKVSPSA